MGLQNPVHGCESRTRLQVIIMSFIRLWASGGIGIHGGLKIRALWHEGSIPSSPTSAFSMHPSSCELRTTVIE